MPADEEDWRRLAAHGELSGKTIHDITNMGSGSRVRKRQFTVFRALWLSIMWYHALFEEKSDYGLHMHLPVARRIVANSTGFNKYS